MASLQSSFTVLATTPKPRNSAFMKPSRARVSCNGGDNGGGRVDRRNMLLGIGGLYGASSLVGGRKAEARWYDHGSRASKLVPAADFNQYSAYWYEVQKPINYYQSLRLRKSFAWVPCTPQSKSGGGSYDRFTKDALCRQVPRGRVSF